MQRRGYSIVTFDIRTSDDPNCTRRRGSMAVPDGEFYADWIAAAKGTWASRVDIVGAVRP